MLKHGIRKQAGKLGIATFYGQASFTLYSMWGTNNWENMVDHDPNRYDIKV